MSTAHGTAYGTDGVQGDGLAQGKEAEEPTYEGGRDALGGGGGR